MKGLRTGVLWPSISARNAPPFKLNSSFHILYISTVFVFASARGKIFQLLTFSARVGSGFVNGVC